MSVKYKRLLNCTNHKHEPQNSLAQLCIEMLIQATKDTKFRKFCFNDNPRYISNKVHKTTFLKFFFNEKQNKAKLKTNKQNMFKKIKHKLD